MEDKGDPDSTRAPAERSTKLTKEECVKLALSLIGRADAAERGMAVLRGIFPDAPVQPLEAGAFHLYRELPSAMIMLLAEIELSLRDPARVVDDGVVWHVIYHLYNWMQMAALLAWARRDIAEEIRAAIEGLDGGDVEFALRTLQALVRCLEGASHPPTIDAA